MTKRTSLAPKSESFFALQTVEGFRLNVVLRTAELLLGSDRRRKLQEVLQLLAFTAYRAFVLMAPKTPTDQVPKLAPRP